MKARTLLRPRERTVEIVKRRLLQKSTPRLHVSLILSLTGLAGFLASFTLLHLHVFSMWLRYPLAILIAYCVFLLLLRVWLWVHGSRWDADADLSWLDDIPTPELDGLHFEGASNSGGCAPVSEHSMVPSSSGGGSSGFDFGLDLDELLFVVLALIAIAAGLLATLYVVYIAPTLLAEILVDGLLMMGLYKRLERIEHRHWLQTAMRQTLLPALLAAFFFGLAGYFLQKAVPGAHSIAEVWRQLN